jgi:hypothetical protein
MDDQRKAVELAELDRDAAITMAFHAGQIMGLSDRQAAERLARSMRAWKDHDAREPRERLARMVLAELRRLAKEGDS